MKNVSELVIDVVKDVLEDQNKDLEILVTEDTQLFGENLDSMGIVFLMTDLESALSDEYDIDVSLADERAMSQKSSPFRTVKTLTKYVSLLISEEQQG
jgi:acyl carrier protein